MRQVTFKEISRSPGRYRRPVYEVGVGWASRLGVSRGPFLHIPTLGPVELEPGDNLGTISWHAVLGWCFVPGKNVYNLNIEALEQIVAFMKTLPIYSSGKTLGTTRTLEQHP